MILEHPGRPQGRVVEQPDSTSGSSCTKWDGLWKHEDIKVMYLVDS